jgi:hypothetical protein
VRFLSTFEKASFLSTFEKGSVLAPPFEKGGLGGIKDLINPMLQK